MSDILSAAGLIVRTPNTLTFVQSQPSAVVDPHLSLGHLWYRKQQKMRMK